MSAERITSDCPECGEEVFAWLSHKVTIGDLAWPGVLLMAHHREEHEQCPLEGLTFVRVRRLPGSRGSLAIQETWYTATEGAQFTTGGKA